MKYNYNSFNGRSSLTAQQRGIRLAIATVLCVGLFGAFAWTEGSRHPSTENGANLIAADNGVNTADTKTFNVDPVHSSVVFRVDHLGVSHFYGRFNDVSGSFTFNDDNPTSSSLNVEVKASSIDTHSASRDGDLKGPDFFDVANFPTISFKADSFKRIEQGKWEATGNLTLHGVTKPLTVTIDQIGEGKDPWGGYRKGIATEFTIKRSDFDMKYLLGGVGDEVNLMISLEAVQSKN